MIADIGQQKENVTADAMALFVCGGLDHDKIILAKHLVKRVKN